MPAVSVVLPTRDRGKTLIRAVQSVLAQSFYDLELLVIDDGSEDDSLARLAEIQDSRLKVYQSGRHMGAGGARNFGVSMASSSLIAFQDSDDLWLIDKLKNQIQVLNDYSVSMVCSGYIMSRSNGRFEYQGAESWMLQGLWQPKNLYQFNYITPTWLIRKEVFEDLGGFDESMPNLEDWELALRLFARGRISVLNKPLVLKYSEGDSLNFNLSYRIESLRYVIDKHKLLLASSKSVMARLHSELGRLYLRAGKPSEARQCFEAALVREPYNIRSWIKYGKSLSATLMSSDVVGRETRKPG